MKFKPKVEYFLKLAAVFHGIIYINMLSVVSLFEKLFSPLIICSFKYFSSGLLRCGKSCRLRWINYLRPDIKRGNFSNEEEETIIKLHQNLGNRYV